MGPMTEHPTTPLTSKQRRIIFLITVLSITALDQASKWYAVGWWKGMPRQSYFGDVFRIEYAENPGAFLSFLAGGTEAVRFWTLTVMNGLVLVGLSIYLMRVRQISFWGFLPLVLVVAGGVGNLIDRIRIGRVIDYFNVGIGELRSGIFNVADMAITAGFVIMLGLMFLERDSKTAETAPPATAPEPETFSRSAG